MKFYHQSDLFQVLVSAALTRSLTPDPALLASYKAKRLARAVKALRSRNVFMYTEGTRTSTALNDISTIYTKPAGNRMMLLGYSDNFRYGFTDQPTTVAAQQTQYPYTHRVRVVGNDGRGVAADMITAQAGVSGQPCYTSVLLPCPLLIEPGQQVAVDLGYDTASGLTLDSIPPQAFVFFCLKVKDKLTQLDYETLDAIKRQIENNNYQQGIYLNCASENASTVVFDSAVAGGAASCETRPANAPLLITGFGTTLGASKLKITDISDDYSFSRDAFVQSSALNMPDFEGASNPAVAPAGAPRWTKYFELPSPHLLKPGAAMHVDVVNGGDIGSGTDSVDLQDQNSITFQAVTV